MDNNTEVQAPVDEQGVDALIDELDRLVASAQKIVEDADAADRETNQSLDSIEASVDGAAVALAKSESEMDELEKSAGNELDGAILQHVEDLTEE